MRAGLRHRVIRVRSRQQSSRCAEHRGADAPVIARAVHALVVRRREQADASEWLGAVEDPFDVVDVETHAFAVGRAERSGLVPHGTGHTEATQIVDERGPAGERRLGRRNLQQSGRGFDEVRGAATVTGEVGAAQVAEVADGFQAPVELLVAERRPFDGFGVDDLVVRIVVDPWNSALRIGADRRDDLRVEVGAVSRPDHVHGVVDSADAVEHLTRLGDVRDPGGERERISREMARHALAVPTRVRLLDARSDLVAQSQAVRELARGRAVVRHLLDDGPSAGGHQLRRLTDARDGRTSRAGPAQHEHHRREARQVDLDGVGAEVDVVTEQRRRFVAVHRTADVREDAHVVEIRQVDTFESEPFAQPHADPCRPEHVLGRLPEPEVGGQRQRHQELAQPHA